MDTKIKILIAGHDAGDLRELHQELDCNGLAYVSRVVQTEYEFSDELEKFEPDIILSEYVFPAFDGVTALQLRQMIAPHTPFIFIAGDISVENSIALIRKDVTAYILKNKLSTLVPKIRLALKESEEWLRKERLQQELILSEGRLANSQAAVKVGSWEIDLTDMTTVWSREMFRIFEVDPNTFQPTFESFLDFAYPDEREALATAILKSKATHTLHCKEHRILSAIGSIKFLEERWHISFRNNIPAGISGTCQDITERKNAEAIQDYEMEDKDALINTTDEPIWSVSRDFKLIASNRAFIKGLEAAVGITLKAGDDLLSLAILPEEFLAFWKTFYIRALKGEAFKEEIYYPALNSENDFWTETSFNPMYSAGIVIGVACYSRNITERKNTEEKLRKSEAHLTEAQRLSKIGSWDYDIAQDKLNWSEQLYKIFDTDREIFGKTHQSFLQLIDEDEREFALKTSQHTQCTGNPFTIEYHITTLKGEKKVIREHGYGVKDVHGKVIGLFGTAQDVTDSKRYEAAIKKAYDEKNTVLESIDAGFFAIDKNSIVTYWNKRAEILLGKTKEEVLGHNLHEMFAATGNQVFFDNYMKAITEKITVNFEAFSTIAGKWFAVSAFGSENGVSVHFQDETDRINSENKLAASELRYRQIVETAQEGIWVIDENNKTTFVNNKLCEIFGYTQQEMMGKDIYHFMDDEGKTLAEIAMQKKRNGNVSNEAFKYISKSGKEIWTNLSANPLYDESGNYEGSLGMITDITDSRIAEERIRNSEAKRKLIMNAAMDAIICIDISGNISFWNPAAETIFGWKEEEVINKKLSSLIIPEKYRQRHDAGIVHYLQTGEGPALNRLLVLSAINCKGDEFPVELTIMPIKLGNEEFFCAFVRDITERQLSESALKDAFNEKNTILESIGDAFFAVDKNWVVSYWNNHAEKMLQTPKETILGQVLWDVFVTSVDSESFKQYHQAVDTRQVVRFEDYYSLLEKWFEISAYPSVNGLAVYFKDITDRKLSEKKMTELNETLLKHSHELAVSNAELEQFAYVASHDLQEPLRMVTGFLTQLEKKYRDNLDVKGKKYIDFAVDGAKRMRQIILDLLEYSRIGRFDENKENIDLNELINNIRILFQKEIEEKKAVIHVDPLPRIYGYSSPLRQVFQNLISNALKYSMTGTTPEIHINVRELDSQWEFTVRDNGIGIEEEYQGRIFEIFQRLHTKDEFPGTGMGLAITKKIIESEGGKIRVVSKPGAGTSFSFTINKIVKEM